MNTCYHCNDKCEETIIYDQHNFCCVGCKSVYEILKDSSLESYYSIDIEPGIKPKNEYTGKYNYLDLEEFKEKLIFFEEGNIAKIKLFLPQIHCSSCLWLLERLHKLKEGVIQSQVSFVEKELVITYDSSIISLRELVEICASIGYPPSFTLNDYNKKAKTNSNRKLIVQIGVAGFCFGNIMLLSFPEYLGIDDTDANFQWIFNVLNFLLSIPVLLIGAKDYLISAYKSLRVKVINIDVPISLGILALYLRSFYEVFWQVGAGYFDSFAGLIFFLLIGKWFQSQTYAAINFERDYQSYFPISVSRKKENEEEEIVALKNVKIGDRLIIRNNELIPTDSILIKGDGNIDYSFVSGESALIGKTSGDKLFAGGRQEGKAIEIEVLKDVENSYLTELWNNPIFNKLKDTSTLSDRISKYFTYFIISVALVASIVWYQIDASKAAFVVTSILIVACPCAIALSVPFTYGNGIRILGRKEFYLRSTQVIEPISQLTAIVFDKTGTITQNDKSSLTWQGSKLNSFQLQVIYNMARHSSHPLSRSIANFIGLQAGDDVTDMDEVSGKGIVAKVNGAEWKLGSSSFVGTQLEDNKTRVFAAVDGQVLGSFMFSNTYREGIEKLLMNLGKKHQLHVLSGDNDAERAALAKLFPKGSIFNFNQQPADKLDYIAKLQEKGDRVMMLGDGLNDAGALRQANVGVSVVDDVYSFSPASDAILNGEKLIALNDYMNFSKFSMNVVKWSYAFSLLYNIIGLSFALTGHLTPLVAAILMPLSSISVVLFVTLMTNLRARKLN